MNKKDQKFSFPDVTVGTTKDYPESTLPTVIYPKEDKSCNFLKDFCSRNKEILQEMMIRNGAVLFRGFEVKTAMEFEEVALKLEDKLDNRYLGTSPRTMVTQFTFTASELPEFFPIPQHIEMAFLKSKPKKLFFFCKQEPKTGGSTPLCHFGKVWHSLPVELKEKFHKNGVKYIRNYCGPKQLKLDPTQLKPWPDIFGTENKKEVEKISQADGLDVEWKKGDGIRLTNKMPAYQTHPITKEEIWHNHSQVFHPAMAHQEYKRIAQKVGGLNIYWLWFFLAFIMFFIKYILIGDNDQSMNCLYGNGERITNGEMNVVRDAIWKNSIWYSWQKGDVVMIDNLQVSHGRFPYTNYPGNNRCILVAWGDVSQ